MAKKDTIEKLYYSIGEIAEMFSVSTSLVRFWETEFSILKPKKNNKGDRRFTQKDIKNFSIIFHLVKEKGYTLEGAKKEIKKNRQHYLERIKLMDRLKELRGFLTELKEKL